MTCIMCDAIPHGLKCTLHGGHMTATEVNLRDLMEIKDGRWVDRPSTPHPAIFDEAALDKLAEWAKRITHDAEALEAHPVSDAIDRMTKRK